MNANKIPQAWLEVLAQIQVEFPSAVIAGGALRDLWHDKPIKDVDVFIPMQEHEMNEDLFKPAMLELDPFAKVIASSVYGQNGSVATPGFRNIYVIWQLNIDNVIYELIFIEDRGETPADVFDISICQIQFDGHILYNTPAFIQTIRDGIIRVTNVNRADRQEKRMARIMAKYPEYKQEIIDTEIPV